MRIRITPPLSLNSIRKALGLVCENEDKSIDAICTDSRLLEEGDLFVAIKGERYDGEDFIAEAKNKGALVLGRSIDSDISVPDTKSALLKIAALKRDNLKNLKEVIAITGSVGKTTTKNVIRDMLSPYFKLHATKENLNNELGVAYTLLSAPESTEVLVVEMGMNHLGEISELSHTVKPTLSVITAIGTAHIGNLGSREFIKRAKLEILDGMKSVRLLYLHESELFKSDAYGVKTVSISDRSADYFLELLHTDKSGVRFKLIYAGGPEEILESSLYGTPFLSALIFAVAVMNEMKLSREYIAAAIKKVSQSSLRGKLFPLLDFFIYDDSYSASYESVLAAFDFLSEYERKSCVLGDMLELGSHTEELHRKIGAEAHLHGFTRLYLFGVYAPFIAEGARAAGMKERCIFINTDLTAPQISARQIAKNHTAGEVVLIKASHNVMAKRIYEELSASQKLREVKNVR